MNISDFSQLFSSHSSIEKLVKSIQHSPKNLYSLQGVSGSLAWFIIAELYKKHTKNILLLLPNSEAAMYAHSDLSNIVGSKELIYIPSSYKQSVVHGQIDPSHILMRTDAYEKLLKKDSRYIVICSPEALIEQVITQENFKAHIQYIKVGERIDTHFLNELLYEYAFERVDFVFEPGQFAIRGSIIDVFSYSHDLPFRIDFFGDEVDSIRTFNIDSQLSVDKLDTCAIIPNVQNSSQTDTFIPLLDYIDDALLCSKDFSSILHAIEELYTKAMEKIQQEAIDVAPQSLMLPQTLHTYLQTHTHVHIGTIAEAEVIEFNAEPQPAIHKSFEFLGTLIEEYQTQAYTTFFATQHEAQFNRIRTIFAEINPDVLITPLSSSLYQGFIDHDLQICCFTDHEIFERYHAPKIKKRSTAQDAYTLQELQSLQQGDYIVHIDHGIGKFAGLERVEINNKIQENIKIIYRDNDILYVNIHNIHKISKYKGKDSIEPKLHKLGSAVWKNTKEKTKSKVKDIAKDLIALYAERRLKEGFRFSPDTFMQQELEASFFFEDTKDQTTATEKVKLAMEASYPMDMLVCGDVGFGKTEIAIRAAFKAVADNKQVAVLVPTTILALQHYKTFSQRLAQFPCRVDYICRLRTTKEQKQIIEHTKNGKVDILIGTHRLVGKDLIFNDLGLLIIDEEQKFGVGIKEKLKQMKVNVDTLTLTATPIPRTLQFSLMGARDLAIIKTPPPNRHPIITQSYEFSEEVLKEAIMNEVARGGQVFVVHNRVKSIYDIEKIVQKLCPKIKTRVGHGQMDGKELEEVLFDFINGDFDVLLATTIIESGIDISNANTIIITDAHNYGLSDLHQLRGRVGRSNKKAYCYLFSPPKKTLTKEARQRLQAIEEYSDLGSGFNIAMQDLDIRGAGDLLGAEQSGFISDIGYETYQKILDEALLELREQQHLQHLDTPTNQATYSSTIDATYTYDCTIETDLELLFAESYIESIKERVKLYRELHAIQDEERLGEFKLELQDRFGTIPPKGKELIDVVLLRLEAMQLGIEKIVLKNKSLVLYFVSNQQSPFYQSTKFAKVLRYVQTHQKLCELKELNQKLSLRFNVVYTVQKAIEIIRSIATTEIDEL